MNGELRGIVKAWEAKAKKSRSASKNRVNTRFRTMSVAHVDDDDDDNNGVQIHDVENVFPNGDVYIGQWLENYPNGNGKYLWVDGCMYLGEWVKGKATGKGKFSWPSGATYEGQFKNGYIDGEGSYTGSTNDTYKGTWVMNMKHGTGTKNYTNGDYYGGAWRKGTPDGQGRYVWSNGNQYIGHWRQGRMNGNGTMMWANGNRYDGSWEDGLPKGNGTFRWADGSFYVGVWSKDEHCGTYYPSDSHMGGFDWDPEDVFLDLKDCRVGPSETISVYPSEKMVQEGESLWRRVSKEGVNTLGIASDFNSDVLNGCLRSGRESGEEQVDVSTLPRPRMMIKPTKRQGVTISKGHKNYELMLNLQLGIRHAVGRPSPTTSFDLKESAFDPKEKVWTRFPSEGSKHTPPHPSCEFKWKDYFPLVFSYGVRTLRKLFKVDPAEYMISLCGNDALRELSSPGKSGSFFYLTHDDKYMIKTMKKSEVKVLKRMLPAYYNHIRAFENTLVTKFFGLHCVKLTGPAQKKVRFVIMGNLFCTEYAIHRRFDLKGSSHGRVTEKAESEIESTTTLKDLDLNFIFRLRESWFQEFVRQVDRDCEFLEQERIMDYSLLVGIHFREISLMGEPLSTEARLANVEQGIEVASPWDILFDRPPRWALGSNMPAFAELTVRRNEGELVGDPTGEYCDVILVFGIIDILQDYDISKKLEHAYKSIQYDPTSISAVDPRLYSKRFRSFIYRIFTREDT